LLFASTSAVTQQLLKNFLNSSALPLVSFIANPSCSTSTSTSTTNLLLPLLREG
jgi:hypothetical protein